MSTIRVKIKLYRCRFMLITIFRWFRKGSMVEDVHESLNLLIVLSVTQVHHALQSHRLIAVSLQNVLEGVHKSQSLLLTVRSALPILHLL